MNSALQFHHVASQQRAAALGHLTPEAEPSGTICPPQYLGRAVRNPRQL
jgi:hypothetical protein